MERDKLREQFQQETNTSFDGIGINGLHLGYIEWLEEIISKERKQHNDKKHKVLVDKMSSLDRKDAKKIIGKVLQKVLAYETSLTLVFTDNTRLEIVGHTFEDCPLFVDFKQP